MRIVFAFFFTSAKFVSGNGPTSPVRWHGMHWLNTMGATSFVNVTAVVVAVSARAVASSPARATSVVIIRIR